MRLMYCFLLTDASFRPATYTSTLVPPALLLLVTYLAILLVYKSIRSFVGLLIFSLKWMVILGVLGVLLAWHFGNGDVQQGAQNLAQQSGMGASSWLDVFGKCESKGGKGKQTTGHH